MFHGNWVAVCIWIPGFTYTLQRLGFFVNWWHVMKFFSSTKSVKSHPSSVLALCDWLLLRGWQFHVNSLNAQGLGSVICWSSCWSLRCEICYWHTFHPGLLDTLLFQVFHNCKYCQAGLSSSKLVRVFAFLKASAFCLCFVNKSIFSFVNKSIFHRSTVMGFFEWVQFFKILDYKRKPEV